MNPHFNSFDKIVDEITLIKAFIWGVLIGKTLANLF